MEMEKKFHGLGLIAFLLGVFRIGFFLLTLALIIWAIGSVFVFFTNIPTINLGFPVMFSLTEEGLFQIPNSAVEGEFLMETAMGVLSSESIPKSFLAVYSLIVLAANICMLLSLRQVIYILESVKTGSFLIIENALRLRWIAILGLIILFFDRLATVVSATYFSDKLDFSGLEFAWFNFFTIKEFDSLFASLFLLVIAEAFRIGALLKQESDLTI